MSIQLYSYFRSSASYRVRIALYLKAIDFEYVPVHLLNRGGEQLVESYRQLNPMAQVPTLVDEGQAIGQSMAILQYLDDKWPTPRLFPTDPFKKAKCLQIAESVNSGIHPIQNLSVLNYLTQELKLSDEQKKEWARHWIQTGFEKLEQMLQATLKTYSIGLEISVADLFIIPQIYNARRFGVDMGQFPGLSKIEENGLKLEAVQKAHPDNQPDSP